MILNGARLRCWGIAQDLTVVNPWTSKQFPMNLEPGASFATSLSAEVLLETLRSAGRSGKVPMNAIIETVFREYRSPRIVVDAAGVGELLAFVKGREGYERFKEFTRSIGSINLDSWGDLERFLHAVVHQGFDTCEIPELAGDDQGESGSD